MKRTVFERIQIWIIDIMTKIRWKPKRTLSAKSMDELKERFTDDYYIVLTRRSNFLTTFFINLSHFFLTGRWGYYSHVLMNLEDEVKTDDDYIFIEAVRVGIKESSFIDVFTGVESVALIKPKYMTIDEWTLALDRARCYLGRPYDNLFDLKNDLEINCVELVRLALQGIPNYDQKFANFEKLVAKKKKLTPQMFAECSDFEIVYKTNSK